MKILVIHGPNLNMLGRREPHIYGTLTLDALDRMIREKAADLDIDVAIFQTNSEAEIITMIQQGDYDALIINPGGFTHTSVAIRDAISAVGKTTIEVHITNIYAREEFRKTSYISAVATGQISGFGPESYILALIVARKTLPRG